MRKATGTHDEAAEPTTGANLVSWPRGVVLVLALLFLAGVVGYRVGRPDPPGAGSAEVGFLQDMIVHHEQAVAMSYRTVSVATDAEVRSFAKEILVGQQYEIGLMEGWLRRWGHPRDSGEPRAMGWAGMAHPKGAMPGMATVGDLHALDEASGPEVDDRFLRMMIEHHAGGVAMAEAILTRTDDDLIRDLADKIIRGQGSEISEMQATRRRLGLPETPTASSDHRSRGG